MLIDAFNLYNYICQSWPILKCFSLYSQPRKRWPRWILPTICFARFVFIPLFIFCNAQPRSFPVVFKHDAFPAVFMLLFAASNGYFGSLGMMYGPRWVSSLLVLLVFFSHLPFLYVIRILCAKDYKSFNYHWK